MSLTSNDLLSTIKSSTKQDTNNSKMAVVTSTSGGTFVKFYGESEPSEKSYKKLTSVSVAVGNVVLLTKVNNSYVITGRIS